MLKNLGNVPIKKASMLCHIHMYLNCVLFVPWVITWNKYIHNINKMLNSWYKERCTMCSSANHQKEREIYRHLIGNYMYLLSSYWIITRVITVNSQYDQIRSNSPRGYLTGWKGTRHSREKGGGLFSSILFISYTPPLSWNIFIVLVWWGEGNCPTFVTFKPWWWIVSDSVSNRATNTFCKLPPSPDLKDIAFYVRLAKRMISYNKKISQKFRLWERSKGTNNGVYIDLLHTNCIRSV